MPNDDWRTICDRGRALRIEVSTLTGQAAGDLAAELDSPAIVQAIGAGTSESPDVALPEDLPEPLASVIAYLGDELHTREFVPPAELVEALDLEPTMFGRQMGELGCQPNVIGSRKAGVFGRSGATPRWTCGPPPTGTGRAREPVTSDQDDPSHLSHVL